MNKSQFDEIIKDPESLNEETLSGIKEIIEEYPFFQLGRMLWLKNLHKLDSIKYNSELKTSAAYIPDRTQLFHLINGIYKPKNNQIEEPNTEEEIVKEVFENTKGEKVTKQDNTKEESAQSVTLTDN